MPATVSRQTKTRRRTASAARTSKFAIPQKSLRPLSLSAERFHDAVMEELPRWKGKSPEEAAAEAGRLLQRLRSLRLIDEEEEERIRQCLDCLMRDDLDAIQDLHRQVTARPKANPVAVAVMGVAMSSVKTLKRYQKPEARAAFKLGKKGWVAFFDVLGGIAGGALGAGIGGVAGGVIGATVVGAAFSAGAAYDMGLI